jgi:hypothetical protein
MNPHDPIGSMLTLSMRCRQALEAAGIATIGNVIAMRPEDLLKVNNFGRRSLKELVGALDARGLKLAETQVPLRPLREVMPAMDAWAACVDALQPLAPAERKRVLATLAVFFGARGDR